MYKAVLNLLVLGIIVQAIGFARTALGSGVIQFGVYFPGWTLGIGMIPALAIAILVWRLFLSRNAASFWIYLTVTILTGGAILNILATLPILAGVATTTSSPQQIVTAGNAILIVMFVVKLVICWMMWQLLRRGEISYQNPAVDKSE